MNAPVFQRGLTGLMGVAALVLAGCAAMGEQTPLAQPVEAGALQLPHNPQNITIAPDWWQALGDATLTRLIDTTLAESPDLAATAARLRQAQASSGLADSQRGVQAAIAADASGIYHESLSNPDSLVSRLFGDTIGQAKLQLQGRWVWDVWGEHKSTLQAALGKEQALIYETAQTRLLLAQAVTAQYMQLQTLQAQQAVLRERLDIKKQQEALVRDRVRAGLMPPSQLYPLQNAQQQMQASLRDLDDKAAQIRHALAALSGQSPEALADSNWQPEPMRALPAPPVDTLTADVLGKRADLAAQRAGIASRGHLIDAAKARFYPNVEIKALAGWSLTRIGDFPSSQSLMAGLLPSVTLPIFTSGALRANLALKQAEYDEQVARYNKSVYQALKEAADALSAYQSVTEREAQQEEVLAISRKSALSTEERVRAGLETRIAVLTARDEVLQAQSQLLQYQLLKRAGWVALNVAFGGGFEAAPANQKRVMTVAPTP